ncbi:MAG: RdgB/HAM1 family non-canonical purine NTP pyrophosphatase [Candidatus Nitrosomaritimum yanchengensis]
MPQSCVLFFSSSNQQKIKETKKILYEIGNNLGFFKCNLEEIQSDSLKEIAKHKATQAFDKLRKPVIVEDDGLFIESLNGFPGPYSSYVFKTIGNKGVMNLVKQKRKAKFVSIISYQDKNSKISFESKINGIISKKISGNGWGYDPIFIPSKFKKTFAELENKNEISHRFKALKKFANWYLDN